MVAEMNIGISHLIGFGESSRFVVLNVLCFEVEKNLSAIVLSYGILRLAIKGIMPHCLVSGKYV